MKGMHMTEFILVIIGGLNWGLIAIGYWMGQDWNVVKLLVGSWPIVENLVYLLVGLSALMLMFSHKRDCRMCEAGAAPMGM